MAGLTFLQTQSGNLTLLVSGGFLFGGLMFGPDLDIHSRQFIRWGWLRWIWIPYQRSLRHRSFLSHGPIISTALRSLYLFFWVALLGCFGLLVAESLGFVALNWQSMGKSAAASLTEHYAEWLALLIGIELGAMSHSLADWGGSAYKRFKSGGLKAIMPKTNPKKRSSSGKSPKRRLEKRTAKNAKDAKKE